MADKKITEKQKKLLKAIRKYINEHGYSPTIRELCAILKLRSTSTVHGYLQRLESGGYITRLDKGPRTIRVTKTI